MIIETGKLEISALAIFPELGFSGDAFHDPAALKEQSKAGYSKDRRNYREVFSPAQAAVIEKAFVQEIDLHRI